MMCKTILELVSSPLLAEMAPPMARGAAAAISADQTGSSHGQMGSSSPPSVGGAPFAVCPMCSWEQLWFPRVINLRSAVYQLLQTEQAGQTRTC